uniref:Cytochrome b6-f complex subunit 6 n=1 Tax=Erythrotrichia carnea TaxID=35151 RepID=A0A1C9CEK7_9RHOD|nr:cytochrome b6-f complex subunit VI [Erythrotrichia carnea]AOM66815.1 cytochrome b6-f complex subunit VI [Erythrotrichia carnea]
MSVFLGYFVFMATFFALSLGIFISFKSIKLI